MIMRQVVLILFVLLIAPLYLDAQGAETKTDETEEYAVYSALISQKFVRDETRLVVITDPTCCGNKDLDPWRLKQLEPISPDTVDSFKERDKETKHLERGFTLSIAYRIVDYKQIEKLFTAGMPAEGLKTFYQLYPQSNGYLTLSRVGFNKDRTEALVNTGWMRGALFGEGHYFLLSKKDGRWRIERSIATWMA